MRRRRAREENTTTTTNCYCNYETHTDARRSTSIGTIKGTMDRDRNTQTRILNTHMHTHTHARTRPHTQVEERWEEMTAAVKEKGRRR